MTGIYKITSKKTGKSYIGQSVHCGKRLDEHCKGDQYIDKIIQTDGIENFTYDILRKANKSELSVWEDYYIMKYNTMYPNGYNKRWNCSKEFREEILKQNVIQVPNTPIIQPLKTLTQVEETLLWLANKLELDYGMHAKNRICTEQQLQKFYQEKEQEINSRAIINDIILNKQGLTAAQQKKIKDIQKAIELFNSGFSTWHIEGIDRIEYCISQNRLDKLYEKGLDYFSMGVPSFGMPLKRSYDMEFDNNSIVLYLPSVTGDQSWQPLKRLFTNNNLNKEKVKIFDKNDNEIDLDRPFNRKIYKEIKLIITP